MVEIAEETNGIIKQAFIELLEKSSAKGKPRVPQSEAIKEVLKRLNNVSTNKKDVKKCMNAMVDDGSLCVWSSGSSSYLLLPKYYEKLKAIEER